MFEELAIDLAYLSNEWNTKFCPLIDTLPDGTDDVDVDAFTDGLDGRTLYVDSSLDSSSLDATFFNATKNRPQTTKEAFQQIYLSIDSQINTLRTEVATSQAILTAEQKSRIGANVFDDGATSSGTSLDGKSENNRLNIIQVAKDLYGSGAFSLDNDGSANLTYSVADAVNALLVIHNGAWNSDIGVDHTGVTIAVSQTDIPSSAIINDNYAGSPTNTQEDLNQVRSRIKEIAGTAAWTTALPALFVGGPDSLKDLLDSTAGTGIKGAANPWGYSYSDIDGLNDRLEAIKDFTGQDTQTDSTPLYTTNNYVEDGDSLETAIGKLDYTLAVVSGVAGPRLAAVAAFIGQDTPLDTFPSYTSTAVVTHGQSLETAIGALDLAIASGSQFRIPVNPAGSLVATEGFIAEPGLLYRLDSSASGFYVSLPTVSGNQGRQVIFKMQCSVASGVTLFPYGSETVDGAGSYTISVPRESVSLISDGYDDWMIV